MGMFIPSIASKNSGSSFFGQKPFRMILPDLHDLNKYLEAHIDRHRGVLLGQARDPGTLFVKTVKTTGLDAAYDSTTFYKAWRILIQRNGIYDPYAGHSAIEGLLPHGHLGSLIPTGTVSPLCAIIQLLKPETRP